MDFKALKYILAVARTGSISQAAQELGISQPSLSRYIQNLNRSLGVQLFARKANRLVLTYAGERYAARAAQILELSEQLLKPQGEETGELRTALRISTPFREGYYIHPFAMMQFKKSFPGTRIIIESNDGTVPANLAEQDGPDIAIVALPSEDERIAYEPLIEDEICLVTASGHPLAQRAIWHEGCRHLWLDAESIKYENFILMPAHLPFGRVIRDFFDKGGISPDIVMETDNIDFSINLAAVGVGVCLVPNYRVHFASYIASPPYCMSVGEPLKQDLKFAYPAHRQPDERIKLFMELVRSFIYV